MPAWKKMNISITAVHVDNHPVPLRAAADGLISDPSNNMYLIDTGVRLNILTRTILL